MTDVLSFIMDFEAGEAAEDEIIDGFQCLIDTGMAWNLQGFYGRTAIDLLEAGHCHYASQAARDAATSRYGDTHYHVYLDQSALALRDHFLSNNELERSEEMLTRSLTEALAGNDGA